MELTYTTKEASKDDQERAFLALSPSERVNLFLTKLREDSLFPKNKQTDKSQNFVIEIAKRD